MDKKNVRISIDEPWDFEIDGSNKIIGEIVGYCIPPKLKNWGSDYLLINLPQVIQWQTDKIHQLLIKTRYTGDNLNVLFKGEEVIVNISKVKEGEIISANQEFRPNQIELFGIGSAKLITEKI